MKLLDLKTLHNTLNWHQKSTDHAPGESVGLFILVPKDIACQFPSQGKEGHDSSPPHITLLYIGAMPPMFEDKLKEVVKNICDHFKSFRVKLGNPKKFTTPEGRRIYHSPVKSRRLKLLNEVVKSELLRHQIPFSNKHPDFKPHVTIEYVEPGTKPKYRDLCPEGEWIVDSIWVWGRNRAFYVLFKIAVYYFI